MAGRDADRKEGGYDRALDRVDRWRLNNAAATPPALRLSPQPLYLVVRRGGRIAAQVLRAFIQRLCSHGFRDAAATLPFGATTFHVTWLASRFVAVANPAGPAT